MSERDYRRWTALMDAETAGEPIDPEDRAFCDALERDDQAAALEAELVEQLRDERHEAPDEAAMRIAAAAVADVMAEAAAPASTHRDAWARPRRLSPWVGGAALAAAVAAAAAIIAGVPAGETPAATGPAFRAEVVYASGDVHIGGAAHRAGAGVLETGVVVETGKGRACLVIDPGIDLCAGESTRLQIVEASETERRVELLAGQVSAALEPQPPGSHFSISAGGVVSTAVGTVFSVARADGGDVATTVTEGRVAVAAGNAEPRMVRAHERAVSGERVRVERVTRMDEARSRATLGIARLWHEGLPATLEVNAPAPVTVSLDGEPVGQTPLVTLAPAGMHEVAVLIDGMPARPQHVRLEAGGRARIELGAAHARTTLEQAGEEAAPEDVTQADALGEDGATQRDPSLDALLRRARSQMLDHRWAAAARSYETLRRRHRGDPEAHAVLVSLGELQLTHLAKPRAALRSFEAYLRQGGPLAQEASHGRIRALRALQRRGAEARAIASFLERHPDSPHREALTRRADELAGSTSSR